MSPVSRYCATDSGIQNFTLWGSNNSAAFTQLTYGTDTNWTQITGLSQSAFDEHTGSDVIDPKFITITGNVTTYQYYAFKIADNHGHATYMAIRHIELQTGMGHKHTIAITSADTFEEKTWDISGIADTDKDAIDQIQFKVLNADSARDFYIDNVYTE